MGFKVRQQKLKDWRCEAGACKRAPAKGGGAQCGDEWETGIPREAGGQQGVGPKKEEMFVPNPVISHCQRPAIIHVVSSL